MVGVEAETGILSPNNQRKHRTSHAPKDVLPLRICANDCAPCQPPLRAFSGWIHGVEAPTTLRREISEWRLSPYTTRWNTALSSKDNLPHPINFRALCGANLVTLRSKIEATKPSKSTVREHPHWRQPPSASRHSNASMIVSLSPHLPLSRSLSLHLSLSLSLSLSLTSRGGAPRNGILLLQPPPAPLRAALLRAAPLPGYGTCTS